MLDVKQRLVGLYILYEIYLHENVRTTPFYQLVLNLLSQAELLHPAERKLLVGFVKSVPKIAKQTLNHYIQEAEHDSALEPELDLEPYRKAHAENMPKTSSLSACSITNLIRDEGSGLQRQDNIKLGHTTELDESELSLNELLPTMLRPEPIGEESYIVQNV